MDNMNAKLKRIVEIAESNGWTVKTEEENGWILFEFYQYSPAGQDFSFSAEAEGYDAASLAENIRSYYDDFDVSEQTYMWLDDSGHGKNGAPYDMINVYEDMEACENMIWCLYCAITNEEAE